MQTGFEWINIVIGIKGSQLTIADSLDSFHQSIGSILFIFQPLYGVKEYMMLSGVLYLALISDLLFA